MLNEGSIVGKANQDEAGVLIIRKGTVGRTS